MKPGMKLTSSPATPRTPGGTQDFSASACRDVAVFIYSHDRFPERAADDDDERKLAFRFMHVKQKKTGGGTDNVPLLQALLAYSADADDEEAYSVIFRAGREEYLYGGQAKRRQLDQRQTAPFRTDADGEPPVEVAHDFWLTCAGHVRRQRRYDSALEGDFLVNACVENADCPLAWFQRGMLHEWSEADTDPKTRTIEYYLRAAELDFGLNSCQCTTRGRALVRLAAQLARLPGGSEVWAVEG